MTLMARRVGDASAQAAGLASSNQLAQHAWPPFLHDCMRLEEEAVGFSIQRDGVRLDEAHLFSIHQNGVRLEDAAGLSFLLQEGEASTGLNGMRLEEACLSFTEQNGAAVRRMAGLPFLMLKG